MGFSVFRQKNDDELRGPSIEALRKGYRIFYGEYPDGPAKGTQVLVNILSSRRVTKKLIEGNTVNSMFPVGLEVLVMLRSAGPGSYMLFPEVSESWDFFSLAPRGRGRMAFWSTNSMVLASRVKSRGERL